MYKLLSLVLLPCWAQAQNLVPNGDFNRVNICEVGAPCAPQGWYTSYDIDWAFQRYRHMGIDGSLCLFFSLDGPRRSCWQSELVAPLKAGEKYRIEYYVRKVEGEEAPDAIRLAFTAARTHLLGMGRPAGVVPAVLTAQRKKQWKDGWMKVTAEYTAAGGEAWIIAGCFVEKAPVFNTFYAMDGLRLEATRKGGLPAAEYDARLAKLYQPTRRHELRPKLPATRDTGVTATIAPAKHTAYISDTLRMTDILFDTDSHRLRDTSILAGWLHRIRQDGYRHILVQGHTDNQGAGERNAGLSARRAGEVAAYLIRHGVAACSLTVTGMGSAQPLRPNDTPENRRFNRRVELIILKDPLP